MPSIHVVLGPSVARRRAGIVASRILMVTGGVARGGVVGFRRLLLDVGVRCDADGVAVVVYLDDLGSDREAVEVGVGKEASGGAGVVEDVEEELTVVIARPRAPANDLLELRH